MVSRAGDDLQVAFAIQSTADSAVAVELAHPRSERYEPHEVAFLPDPFRDDWELSAGGTPTFRGRIQAGADVVTGYRLQSESVSDAVRGLLVPPDLTVSPGTGEAPAAEQVRGEAGDSAPGTGAAPAGDTPPGRTPETTASDQTVEAAVGAVEATGSGTGSDDAAASGEPAAAAGDHPAAAPEDPDRLSVGGRSDPGVAGSVDDGDRSRDSSAHVETASDGGTPMPADAALPEPSAKGSGGGPDLPATTAATNGSTTKLPAPTLSVPSPPSGSMPAAPTEPAGSTSEPEAMPMEGGDGTEAPLVEALLDELRTRQVSDQAVGELRSRLGVAGPTHSFDARLQALRETVADLVAYRDSLETFIDEEGSGRAFMEGVSSELGELQAAVESIDDRVERLEGIDQRVDCLEAEFAALESDLESLREDQPDDVPDRLDRLDQRLAELADRVETNRDWQRRYRDSLADALDVSEQSD